MVTRTLQDFGLTENEACIYREAVKVAETNPYALSKATGIPRTTVYEIIMSLSLKGLLDLKRSDGLSKQQTSIRAKNPSILRTILKKRHEELVHLENDVVHVLPFLKGDFHSLAPNADFQFFPGIEGAKHVFILDQSLPDQESLCWNYKIPDDAFGRDFINANIDEEIHHTRTHRQKDISPLNDWTRHVFTYQCQRDPKYLGMKEFRYIENPLFTLQVRLEITGNQVQIVSVEGDECWGLVIKSETLATSMRSIFMLQWQMALPITAEVVKSWGSNDFFEAEKQ